VARSLSALAPSLAPLAKWLGPEVSWRSGLRFGFSCRSASGHRIRPQVGGGTHPRFARNSGIAGQLPTATMLAPVDIELDHAAVTLSLRSCPDNELGAGGLCQCREHKHGTI
jgi:hypothetical protein